MAQSILYYWTLPTTYAIANVGLSAFIYDGPTTNPATHTCLISSTAPLTTTSTSGIIAIPPNMSACGLDPSVAIQHIAVLLVVNGVAGEQNVIELGYPF